MLAATFRRLVLQGPDGETEAHQLATDVRTRLADDDYAAAVRVASRSNALLVSFTK